MPELGYLRQLTVHEALTAEAGLYRHDQSHVEAIYKRVQYACRSPRLERKADLLPVFLNDINSVRYVLIRVRLDMEHNKIGTGIAKCLCVSDRLIDHQMNIKEHLGHFPHRLQNGNADRDIGNEKSVHNVKMNIFRTGRTYIFNLDAEFRKIGREDRGSYLNHINNLGKAGGIKCCSGKVRTAAFI